MKILLDTHVFVWLLRESQRINPVVLERLRSSETQLFVSVVTTFEIANKYRIGKMPEAGPILGEFERILASLQAEEISFDRRHAVMAGSLPSPHRDPFDRMLAAQSIIEQLTLVSADTAFDSFGIQRYW